VNAAAPRTSASPSTSTTPSDTTAREFYDVVTGLWDSWADDPVIVQAGSSELGRALAAETADVVFSAHPTLADGQRFYADVKSRMAAWR
jgi:alkanesulfonate monooxygenase SsuD/methylene tetrahydromethanopterin reductase-like flavin-dependent oxidoreductase (luciferase family)